VADGKCRETCEDGSIMKKDVEGKRDGLGECNYR